MHKKTTCFILPFSFAICILASAMPGHAQAKIETILDLMNSQASVDKMFDQVTAMVNTQMQAQTPNASPEQLAQAEAFQKKLMELVKSRVSWEKMRPEFIRIYGETNSDDEINGMLAFFQSPAGRGFLGKSPVITQKVMAFSQSQLGDLMPEIQRMVKESAQKRQ